METMPNPEQNREAPEVAPGLLQPEAIEATPKVDKPQVMPNVPHVETREAAPVVHQESKEAGLKMIEEDLSEGLMEPFKQLSTSEQLEVKLAGEKFSREVWEMRGKKVKVHHLLVGTRKFLQKFPKLNWGYVEQATKNKTDRLLKRLEDSNNAL